MTRQQLAHKLNGLKIRSIQTLKSFSPFETTLFEFQGVQTNNSPQAEVHLLTGINGTGKSRLLYLIAAILGNPEPLKRKFRELTDFRVRFETDRHVSNISFEAEKTLATAMGKTRAEHFFYPKAFAYSGIPYVTDTPLKAMEMVAGPDVKQKLSFQRSASYSAFVGQTFFNQIMMASSHARMKELNHPTNPELALAFSVVKRLESVLTAIVGQTFSFFATPYPKPTLKVNLGPNSLELEQLPDGIRSILGWLLDAIVSLLAMSGEKRDPFEEEIIFLFDEIEAHLHPAWQRKLLPAFQRMFPHSQIIAATHSPFLISSLNQGWIHRFYLENGFSKIAPPTLARLGDSYEDVMEDIMGVSERLDDESLEELASFRKLRDQALEGDNAAREAARSKVVGLLDSEIGPELEDVLSRELRQMERLLREKHEAANSPS